MGKVKTRKAISKRLKVTGTGKILRRRPGSGHLKSRKSPKQLRRFRQEVEVPRNFLRQAKRMLGM